MILSGSVENIIYQNFETGYTVAEIGIEGQLVTCVGSFPMLSEGEYITADGEFKSGKYGRQFVAETVSVKRPDTCEGIMRYLSSGLIKGVGEITAAAIVNRFGEYSLDIITDDPARLTEIRGIGKSKAMEIAKAVSDLKGMQDAVMFLQNLKVSPKMAIRIYKKYTEDTQRIVSANPYCLIEDVDGIGFLTADRIAKTMGIEETSEFRIRAGILFALKEYTASSGSTYVLRRQLLEEAFRVLRVNSSCLPVAEKLITDLCIDNYIVAFDKDGEKCLALKDYYNKERFIAIKLLRLQRQKYEEYDCEQEITEYERINGITLHEMQKQAVRRAVNEGVLIITGGPGTGKTTIVKCILHVLSHLEMSAALCAPTGRAAKRLSDSTGEQARTVHRLLGFDYQEGGGFFVYNEKNRLPHDVCIVDEVSMLDCSLMYYLTSAIKEGGRLILVGDKDQLPSVSAGNVLKDMIASEMLPVVMLNKIYRQGETSQIVANAHLINSGEMPLFKGRESDFLLCERERAEDILDEVISMYTRRIPDFLKIEPTRIQVLAPMKKGICGVENLNERLQELVNPKQIGLPEYQGERVRFRIGDKVMQTVNNYSLEWDRINEDNVRETGTGVFNGDMGSISAITMQTGEIEVEMEDGRYVRYSLGESADLSLAYAISIHKSQGSEFDVIIVPITGGRPSMMNRNLLYTAITRAKKLVVLVGSKRNISAMVMNNYTEKRYTLLADFLREGSVAIDKLFCNPPIIHTEEDILP